MEQVISVLTSFQGEIASVLATLAVLRWGPDVLLKYLAKANRVADIIENVTSEMKQVVEKRQDE